MPVYEYKCKECSHNFKTLVRSGSSADAHCPSCGAGRVVKLLSVTAQPQPESASPPVSCGAGGCMNGMCGCMPGGMNQ